MWKAAESAPDAWPAEAEDSTPSLQQAGRIGAWAYLSGSFAARVTANFDELTARPLP